MPRSVNRFVVESLPIERFKHECDRKGAAIRSAIGGSIGGTNVGSDCAAGIGAGAGYGAHRLIKRRGGYRAVAEAASPAVKEAGGRMLAVLRRALVKSAAKI